MARLARLVVKKSSFEFWVKGIKSVFLWTDSAIAPGLSPTVASSARRSLCPECTRTSRDILPQGMRSCRNLFRGWMASIPSSGFLKIFTKTVISLRPTQTDTDIFPRGPQTNRLRVYENCERYRSPYGRWENYPHRRLRKSYGDHNGQRFLRVGLSFLNGT